MSAANQNKGLFYFSSSLLSSQRFQKEDTPYGVPGDGYSIGARIYSHYIDPEAIL